MLCNQRTLRKILHSHGLSRFRSNFKELQAAEVNGKLETWALARFWASTMMARVLEYAQGQMSQVLCGDSLGVAVHGGGKQTF